MAVVKPFIFRSRKTSRLQLGRGKSSVIETWKLNTKRKWNGLYIDPPHEFSNKKTGGGMKSGSSQKYPTLKLQTICDMPISEISEDRSILFCWIPSPLSDTHGHEIFDAWGFKFKGKIYWVKDRVDDSGFNIDPMTKYATITKDGGWGYNFRSKVEELWFGIKGTVPAFRNPTSNVIYHRRSGHSIKPDIFREIVEDQFDRSFGKKKKMIEGFARQATFKTTWSYFGNELRSQPFY